MCEVSLLGPARSLRRPPKKARAHLDDCDVDGRRAGCLVDLGHCGDGRLSDGDCPLATSLLLRVCVCVIVWLSLPSRGAWHSIG